MAKMIKYKGERYVKCDAGSIESDGRRLDMQDEIGLASSKTYDFITQRYELAKKTLFDYKDKAIKGVRSEFYKNNEPKAEQYKKDFLDFAKRIANEFDKIKIR